MVSGLPLLAIRAHTGDLQRLWRRRIQSFAVRSHRITLLSLYDVKSASQGEAHHTSPAGDDLLTVYDASIIEARAVRSRVTLTVISEFQSVWQ